jgi:hypothetical protein
MRPHVAVERRRSCFPRVCFAGGAGRCAHVVAAALLRAITPPMALLLPPARRGERDEGKVVFSLPPHHPLINFGRHVGTTAKCQTHPLPPQPAAKRKEKRKTERRSKSRIKKVMRVSHRPMPLGPPSPPTGGGASGRCGGRGPSRGCWRGVVRRRAAALGVARLFDLTPPPDGRLVRLLRPWPARRPPHSAAGLARTNRAAAAARSPAGPDGARRERHQAAGSAAPRAVCSSRP